MAGEIDAAPVVVHIAYRDPSAYEVIDCGLRATMHTNRESFIAWNRQQITGYLQKSEDGIGGWVYLKRFSPADLPQFIDWKANNTFHRHGYEYYRLIFPDAQKVSEVASVHGDADFYGSEIARRHRILLKAGRAGNKCWAFVRMRQGIRCPVCWDEILQQRTRSDCPTCNSTGYLTGFYDPHELYVSFSPEASRMETSTDGPRNSQGTVQGWTSNFPMLSTGDVVIDNLSHAVWVVIHASFDTSHRAVTKQDIVLERSVGDDAIWSLIGRIPGGA